MKLSTVEAFKWIRPKNARLLSDAELAQLQRTLAGILRDVEAACAESGATALMGGGSCLGAVRHAGFVPWDDDIDLNMTRADWEKFLPVFEKRFSDRYWIHTPRGTRGYGLTFPRILLKGTSVRTREDFHNEECGAFIDIFLVESTYDGKLPRAVHGLLCLAAGFLQSCRKFFRDRREILAMCDDTPEGASYRRVFLKKIRIGALLAPVPMDAWTALADRVYGLCRREDTAWITVPSGKGHFFGELYGRSSFFPAGEAEFEGQRVHVPADADAYLTRLYGDWRAVPDPDHVEHHVFFEPFVLGENERE